MGIGGAKINLGMWMAVLPSQEIEPLLHTCRQKLSMKKVTIVSQTYG